MKQTISDQILHSKGVDDKAVKHYYNSLKTWRRTVNKDFSGRFASEYYFELPGGLRFFYQVWESTLKKFEKIPKAIILALHGQFDSSDIFYPLADALTTNGIMIIAPDYRGHGRTGGQAGGHIGDIDSFNDIIKDIQKLLIKINKDYKDVPIYLLGYDLGTLLCLHSIAKLRDPIIQGMILISPLWNVKNFVGKVISLPFLTLGQLYKNGEPLLKIPSEIMGINYLPEYVEYSKHNEFRLTRISVRFQKNMISFIQKNYFLHKYTNFPCLILQGTADQEVNHFSVFKQFYKRWIHPDKKIRLYENAGHNLFADRYSMEIYDEIKQFLLVNR